MTQDNIRNPAVWLLDVWGRMPVSGEVMSNSTMLGWASTFGMEANDISVFDAIGGVYSTVSSAVTLVQRLDISDKKKDQLVRWQPAFQEALVDLHRGYPWQHAVGRFTPDRKVHLEYCATELDTALDGVTTIEDIQNQARHIEDLISELQKDSGVDEQFKLLIHDLLEALRRSLNEYQIRGSKGVMDSISSILANIFRYQNLFDTDEKKKWGKQLREVVSLAADVATITGATAFTIGSSVATFLPLF